MGLDKNKRPNLDRAVVMVNKTSQSSTWYDEELYSERISHRQVCSFELSINQRYCSPCQYQKEDFHQSVVWRDKMCEQIHISCGEHQRQ